MPAWTVGERRVYCDPDHAIPTGLAVARRGIDVLLRESAPYFLRRDAK
jgi:hypothetical protein